MNQLKELLMLNNKEFLFNKEIFYFARSVDDLKRSLHSITAFINTV